MFSLLTYFIAGVPQLAAVQIINSNNSIYTIRNLTFEDVTVDDTPDYYYFTSGRSVAGISLLDWYQFSDVEQIHVSNIQLTYKSLFN